MPVKFDMQVTDGFWVTGLPQRVTIITVGQEYVVDGQTVAVEVEDENA
jgi:multidrug efflux system membrane fusion protein